MISIKWTEETVGQLAADGTSICENLKFITVGRDRGSISNHDFSETMVMFMHIRVQKMELALRKLLITLSDFRRIRLENWLKITCLLWETLKGITVTRVRGFISSYEFHETPVMFMNRGVQQMSSALAKLFAKILNDFLSLKLVNWLKLACLFWENLILITVGRDKGLISIYKFHRTPVMFMHRGVQQIASDFSICHDRLNNPKKLNTVILFSNSGVVQWKLKKSLPRKVFWYICVNVFPFAP